MSGLACLQRLSLLIALIVFLNLCLMPIAQATSPGSDTPSITELVRKAVVNYKAIQAQQSDYTYLAHLERTDFDRHGKVFNHVTSDYEVMFLAGAPYRRLVLSNDLPLSPEQEREEQNLLEAEARARQAGKINQPPAPTSFLAPVAQLPNEFHLRSRGRQRLDGRELQVIEAMPKNEDQPVQPEQEYARHFRMRLWIDTTEFQIVRLEAKVINGAIEIHGPVLVLDPAAHFSADHEIRFVIAPGAVIAEEWTKANDQAWLPRRFYQKTTKKSMASASPGIAPVVFASEFTWTYSEYKKFRVDTHVVPK